MISCYLYNFYLVFLQSLHKPSSSFFYCLTLCHYAFSTFFILSLFTWSVTFLYSFLKSSLFSFLTLLVSPVHHEVPFLFPYFTIFIPNTFLLLLLTLTLLLLMMWNLFLSYFLKPVFPPVLIPLNFPSWLAHFSLTLYCRSSSSSHLENESSKAKYVCILSK